MGVSAKMMNAYQACSWTLCLLEDVRGEERDQGYERVELAPYRSQARFKEAARDARKTGSVLARESVDYGGKSARRSNENRGV